MTRNTSWRECLAWVFIPNARHLMQMITTANFTSFIVTELEQNMTVTELQQNMMGPTAAASKIAVLEEE